ncbi:MAG: protease complex subunit PrcB family protein [Firmicutes bacterium]|nr:protease complex subunit PrcB family protein [Bacillota bacterium]MDD4263809.1 protease complex subunit PrcB family protein [Bacillota bacterium]MDD4693556.1 protease complex subunit PrcB family protein [Bacillota bacterium]
MGLNRRLPLSKIDDLEYFHIEDSDDLPGFALSNQDLISDLDNSTCLIISRGEKTSGGYQIDLVSTKFDGDHLTVELNTSDPKPGSMNIMVLTYPWVHVKTKGAKTYSVILNQDLIVKEQYL